MNRKRLLITVLLLMVGGGFGVYCLQKNRKPDVDPVSSSKQNEVIIAPAIIDAPNDITRIPSLQSGMMKQIDVQVGDQVKKGQPLFSLESGLVENALHINQLSVLQAKHALRIQKKQLKHLENQLARLNRLDKRAISMAELQEKQHEVNIAKAQLAQGVVNEALAQSQLKNTELTLEQYSVVAPKEGVVLQINAHPHEFVSGGQPLIYLGDAKKIIVRVSIDERDAYRFRPDLPASLINYGNAALNAPLTFMQLDRYIVVQERLNSRVQEVLYSCDRQKYPAYIAGQLFDVSILVKAYS